MEVVKYTEPPKMYHTWVALSTLAGALQRKCCLQHGSVRLFPNLYIVLVGPPGRCRKGTAMGFGKKLLHELEVPLAAQSLTREALGEALLKSESQIPDPEGKVIKIHSSLTVFSDELIVFIGRQNQTLIDDLTDWFDCHDSWEYKTKTQGGVNISNLWVNILGATTPEVLRNMLPADAIGGGLTSRLILVFEANKDHIEPFPAWGPEQEKLWDKLVHDLKQIHQLNGNFRVARDVHSAYIEWYTLMHSKPPFEDHRLAYYMERRQIHLLKMCMILSASRSNDMIITLSDFERAVKLLERTEVKMPQAFTGVGKNAQVEVLERIWAELALQKTMTFAQILERFHMDSDSRTLEAICRTLAQMKIISITYNDRREAILTYVGNKENALDRAIAASQGGGHA